ncbi:MAG: heat-inducible transcriptional repressor [Candidatus Aldehydirespiratoraceae bacterium]|jgi:heat-inducible transcriptional repressor
MLDDRKAAILSAVVQEYIATAQPVGSGKISDVPGISVSSATVRNEMAALEEQGFLVQPHTSAGRIPTDKGYRFFVDELRSLEPALIASDRGRVKDFFDATSGALESTLAQTSDLLTDLTNCTAVVVGPSGTAATIRSTQLVDLSTHIAMVVAVMSNGVIEKRTVEVAVELTAEIVEDAGRRLAVAVDGKTLAELEGVEEHQDPLLDAALAALSAAGREAEVYIGGASRVASAFDAVDQVRDILTILEQQIVVVTLISDVLGRGMRVAIGGETGVEPLAECSLVVAPYLIEGELAGTVGVLGPTRMNYAQALAAVAVVSRRLGNVLSEG